MLNLVDCKNSKKQGDVGMGVAIGWFAANGYTVCVPLTDSQDYDLVVDDGNGCKRVQVKTTRYKDKRGNYVTGIKVCGGNQSGAGKIKYFDKKSCDLLFVVCEDESKYLIPSKSIKSKSTLTVSSYSDYKVLG